MLNITFNLLHIKYPICSLVPKRCQTGWSRQIVGFLSYYYILEYTITTADRNQSIKSHETLCEMMKKVNTIPEAVVFFDVFAQLGNISIFSLPRRLIVRQVAPFHQVPQRTVFHQSENEHRSTAFLTTFKTLTKFSQQQ